MPLIKDGALADDAWVRVGDDEALPEGPAVVSLTRGRTTGTPSTSAWNCMSSSLCTMPPSTLSAWSSTPESRCMASSTSRVW